MDHAAQTALQDMKAEEAKVKRTTNRDTPASSKAGSKDLEVNEVDVSKLEFIRDNGDGTCTVSLKGEGRTVRVGDPGMKHASALGFFGMEMSPRQRADVALAVSRAVIKFAGLEAARPNKLLGLAAGEALTQPYELEDEHVEDWDRYDNELSLWQREIVKVSEDETAIPGPQPDAPRTKLESLMLEVLSTNDFQRIMMGFRFNCLDEQLVGGIGGDSGNS